MSAGKNLKHKAGVAKYWLGVAWFKASAPLYRIRGFFMWLWAVTKGRSKELYVWLVYLHWLHPMKLGVYSQYTARPARIERFPRPSLREDRLPSMAIVTPSYNQAEYVGQTIQSVVSQGHPDLRYAVLDGGSKDGSAEIIETFRPQLAYAVSERDNGQADAIVRGFEKVQGEIMAYLNSDDMLMPGTLRFVGEFFANNPGVDVVYGHRVVIDAQGREIGHWVVPRHCLRTLKYMDFVPQETLFWRRSLYEKVGGIDPSFRFAIDWDLLLRFANAGAVFHRLPYFLAYFRSHDEQKSHTIFESVGARESSLLMEREHSGAFTKKMQEKLYLRYCRKGVLHALLLDLGIRR